MSEKRALRGFALISPDRRREIAKLGGKAIPREKRHFARDPEKARAAGKVGGLRRREANEKDTQLLRKALVEPVSLPAVASGRTERKVARLLRLGYWEAISPVKLGERRFAITDAGREFLAQHGWPAPEA